MHLRPAIFYLICRNEWHAELLCHRLVQAVVSNAVHLVKWLPHCLYNFLLHIRSILNLNRHYGVPLAQNLWITILCSLSDHNMWQPDPCNQNDKKNCHRRQDKCYFNVYLILQGRVDAAIAFLMLAMINIFIELSFMQLIMDSFL